MKTRICTRCKVGWDKHKSGLDCPECNDQGMFTIDTGAKANAFNARRFY